MSEFIISNGHYRISIQGNLHVAFISLDNARVSYSNSSKKKFHLVTLGDSSFLFKVFINAEQSVYILNLVSKR